MTRILVVDDDPLASEIVVSVLQSKGLLPDLAGDGFAALRMLRETPYDLVLVDYHLPEMDGYALAKLMRDLTTGRATQLRLVGVTADRHGLATRRGVDGIFDAILAKPWRPAELFEQVDLAATSDASGPHRAAASFLSNPDLDRARHAAMAFWHARGLASHPKVAIFPNPTVEQAEELHTCFDIVDRDSAEMLLLLDVRGLQELLVTRINGGNVALPVITFDPALSAVCEGCLDVADRESWSQVAELLKRRSA